jgi:hypothetical protein
MSEHEDKRIEWHRQLVHWLKKFYPDAYDYYAKHYSTIHETLESEFASLKAENESMRAIIVNCPECQRTLTEMHRKLEPLKGA